MTTKRAFISFDFDHDEDLRILLVGQAKNPDTPFNIFDWSVKEPLTGDWKEKIRSRIRRTDLTIVICGEYTHIATGVAAEITITQEERNPYFLLNGRSGKTCEKPTSALQSDEVYKWTWENLKQLIGGARLHMSDKTDEELICQTRETYGETFRNDLFAQYKLYVESAEKISERRVSSNNFLLTVNAFLVTLNGFQAAIWNKNYWGVLIPLAGFLVSLTWLRIIISYSNLNAVKFKVIHELEKHLPAALYSYEWQKAELGRGKVYRPMSHLERWIPVVFIILYVVLAIAVVWNGVK